MKKLILTLCLALLSTSLFAQEHIFEVKRLNNWGKEYLTIVNNHFYMDLDENDNIEQIFTPYESIDGYIYLGMIILEINGQSTKNMSEDVFYTILDNSLERIELKVWDFKDKEPHTVIIKSMDTWIPEWANKPYIQKALKKGFNGQRKDYQYSYDNRYENIVARREGDFKNKGIKCTELVDPDFDWFYVRTYDFAIVGNDPLVDRAILEKVHIPSHWTRDTENPDVIFTIAKDSKQSISSTYVPPTVRTINHGSQTKARYNALTNATEYTTTQNNQTIREGGYTQTTSNTDMFLELALLDAKRINDPNQQAAPIVWQATFNAHTTANVNVTEVYKAWATWVVKYDTNLVNATDVRAYTLERLWALSGVDINMEPIMVTYATPDSPLQVGDRIMKYKMWNREHKDNVLEKDIDKNYYNATYNLIVKRKGEKKSVKLYNVPISKKTGAVVVCHWKEYDK